MNKEIYKLYYVVSASILQNSQILSNLNILLKIKYLNCKYFAMSYWRISRPQGNDDIYNNEKLNIRVFYFILTFFFFN